MDTQTQSLFCVVTTIQAPTDCMKKLAEKWPSDAPDILIVGDSKGPFEYALDHSELLTIEAQRASQWGIAKILPEKHYARKNIGYLEAIHRGATTIFETDDDNAPESTWTPRAIECEVKRASGKGWYNVYEQFSEQQIWPRGFPLRKLLNAPTVKLTEATEMKRCPLQQGLANGSPDVDAIWRLILDKEITFKEGDGVLLHKGLWCPFNSQSTWWWRDAYPLMYLPSLVPFRMTDIWRSFIAQRCLWAMDYELVFHEAEMFQERNHHDYLRDFEDEVSGYLRNEEIGEVLANLDLDCGVENASKNLLKCYLALEKIGIVPKEEIPIVEAWIEDLSTVLS
jgi:hypothetical protein